MNWRNMVSKSKNWQVLGCLTTLRYEMKTAIGLMALDQSRYFDMTDYELELEVENHEQGKQDFRQFLEKNQISYQKLLQNWFDLSKV